MMTGAVGDNAGDVDNISSKTLTASSTGAASVTSDKGDRNSIQGDVSSYQPSIFIRIFVGDFNLTKCLQFPPTTPIWEIKQKLYSTLPKELKDGLNYGLFCPPFNGRAGKFLDDERMLQDYPMPGHVGYLELKYKRRVYKMMNLDEKVLKQLHTKANLRKFIDYVLSGQSEKVSRLCEKGLDPNFHDLDSGETPLTLATSLKEPAPVLAALINGGAHLDFRALDGCTALHRAAQQNNCKALQGLLELGSSANYKDAKNLTPLYYSVTHAKDPTLCELLLHNYALLGAVDSQGWQEIHQACRYGHIRHLEHLIFYGADIDARNASGNTPLHTAAVNNQESCARVLLFRGVDKHAKNYANQTAYHVAIIAGAVELAEVIKRHSSKDIVPLREKPKYNPRRRRRSGSPGSTISRTSSVNRLGSRSPSVTNGPVASPSPSQRSYMMFSTTDSVSSSNGSTYGRSQPSEDCTSSGVVTDKSSCSDESTCTPSTMNRVAKPVTNGGTARSSRALERDEITYGTTVFADQKRNMNRYSQASDVTSIKSVPNMRADSAFSSDSFTLSRDPSPSMDRGLVGLPRTVTLVRSAQGYGFVLRGSKSGNQTVNREIQVLPGDDPPALQYLDEVDRGGPADLAGLQAGDYLLSINAEDVRTYPHERAVNLIRHAAHTVTLVVMTPPRMPGRGTTKSSSTTGKFRKNSAMAIPPPPVRNPRTALTIGPERSKSYIGLNDIGAGNHDTMTSESAKIASIRARPVSKRITASEIEELLVRQGSVPSNPSSPPTPTMSSFIPLPGSTNKPDSRNSTASRVFTSVAHMKRQRAALQQQRRKTDVVSTTGLHKDYHSTPDLNMTGDEAEDMTATDGDVETEDLYSDTVFHSPNDVTVVYQQYGQRVPDIGSHVLTPAQHQAAYHNGYRSVPITPSGTNTYARPIVNSASSKPPLPPNRPPVQQPQTHLHPYQQTLSRPHDRSLSQSRLPSTSMKPSQSLDERAYAQVRYHTAPQQIYAAPAPEDPEPDYFSDEDRNFFASTAIPQPKPVAEIPRQVSVEKAKPAPSRTMANPPPPPPPPVATNGQASSFAAAIAKAAQARQAKTAENPNRTTSAVTTSAPLKPVQAAPAPTTPKVDAFQSELMKAIQRRSVDRDDDGRRNSGTDSDAANLKENTNTSVTPSSVKDRIIFLERQTVPSGPQSIKISGITTDQSSTDQAAGGNATAVSIRAGVNATKNGQVCHDSNGLGFTEIDEATAAKYGVFRSGNTILNTGFLRDHDSASINSQSSASTLSSGYESPTLKYGSNGEHVWAHILQTPDHQHAAKFSPSIDILPELVPIPGDSFAAADYDANGVSIAPPPEFS